MRNLISLVFAVITVLVSLSAQAESDPKKWPVVKEAFFAGRTITEVDYIKFTAPRRAESGAQVPIYQRGPN